MKPITSLALLVGALAAGCSAYQGRTVLAPVGPVAGQTVAATSVNQNGSLLVYSAYDVNPEFNNQDIYRPRYTDYRIQTEAGQPLKFVHNNSGTSTHDPVPVKLPAGKYRVVARANGYGQVTVPVIIEAQKLTTVHLETDVSLAK